MGAIRSTLGIEVIAANDDVQNSGVDYFNNGDSRRINNGASLFGWYWRERSVSAPNPSQWNHARLTPADVPSGDVAVIWSDPAVAASPTDDTVLMGFLMVPSSKFPTSPIVSVATYSGTQPCGAPGGGVCFARSTDGGKNFAIVDCFKDSSISSCPSGLGNSTNGHFVDGLDATIGADKDRPGQEIAYTASIDTEVVPHVESLWKLQDPSTGSVFEQVDLALGPIGRIGADVGGTPTSNIISHVRLRMSSNGSLWRMAPSDGTSPTSAALKVNILDRNAAPVLLTDSLARTGSNITVGGLNIRIGPQYAFDIGQNEFGEEEMRFVFTAFDGTNHFLQAGYCDIALNDCVSPVEWRSAVTSEKEIFSPLIKYGNANGTPAWKITYMERVGTSQVQVVAGDLTRLGDKSQRAFLPTRQVVSDPQTPCPGGTYWGDYDGMAFNEEQCTFLRPYSDSSSSACERGKFNSSPVEISMVEMACGIAQPVEPRVDGVVSGENISQGLPNPGKFEVCGGASGFTPNGDVDIYLVHPSLNAAINGGGVPDRPDRQFDPNDPDSDTTYRVRTQADALGQVSLFTDWNRHFAIARDACTEEELNTPTQVVFLDVTTGLSADATGVPGCFLCSVVPEDGGGLRDVNCLGKHQGGCF